MQFSFHRLLQDATRLTRSGRLQAATHAIHPALRAVPGGRAEAPSSPADIVIDVEAREPGTGSTTAPQAPPRGEGSVVTGRFGSGTQARDWRLYIPPQAGERPLPLVVMLHGCKQDPDDFAAGTRMDDAAREHGCFVLYPAQSKQANPQGCWNWFKHSHQQRGRGEPALLAGMTRDILQKHPVDPARVYVAGLSAGGAMAAILAGAYPELYAAAGVHSGLAAGSADDLSSALAAMRSGSAGAAEAPDRPIIVFHGDADRTVHPSNGGHVLEGSLPAGTAAETQQERPGRGRGYTRSVHRAPDGRVVAEHWVVHGSPHAWSGGSAAGSYTDPKGPDATREMLRFFLAVTPGGE
ncbi:PHB depolymerase family esterase [Ramlibacter terrae]|uniref:PHB depolymerase family esterase n=1 Tax=Ramlibacter terrae TaxID=2732511 RepID=A0ABX6P317_9BURK|nr:PHB depolymerase family esterase [Ramlibacter terrae]